MSFYDPQVPLKDLLSQQNLDNGNRRHLHVAERRREYYCFVFTTALGEGAGVSATSLTANCSSGRSAHLAEAPGLGPRGQAQAPPPAGTLTVAGSSGKQFPMMVVVY